MQVLNDRYVVIIYLHNLFLRLSDDLGSYGNIYFRLRAGKILIETACYYSVILFTLGSEYIQYSLILDTMSAYYIDSQTTMVILIWTRYCISDVDLYAHLAIKSSTICIKFNTNLRLSQTSVS